MKIAVLTNAYPPKAQGGAGRIAFEYTKILESLGHEAKVWGPSEKFFELGKKSALARLFFHLKDLKEKKDIVEGIVAWKPEVLMTHSLTGCGFGTPIYLLKRSFDSAALHSGRRMKWIHVLHDVQLFEPSGQVVYGEKFTTARRVWCAVWGWLRKRNLGEPDIVISPTKWLMDEHLKRGFFKKAQKEVVWNPLSHNPLCPPYLKGEIGRGGWRGYGERNQHQLLFVGRLDRDKGIDLLLEAWPKMRGFADMLVVVGGGERLEELRAQHKGVEFKGQLASEDVLKIMAQSGVLVVPSLVMENQPTVILEGLACGCKVVASDVGGVRETLGEAGWIFKPGSLDDLVRTVKEAMGDVEAGSPSPGRGNRAPTEEILKLHDPGTVAGILGGLLKSNL